MKTTKNSKPAPRNYSVLAMTLHCKASRMRDRRENRGGAKNKQAAYRSGDY